MPDLLERDDLLVVLLDDPFDPAPSLTAEPVAQPLEPLPQRGVVARTLSEQATGSLDSFLRQRRTRAAESSASSRSSETTSSAYSVQSGR